MQTLLLRLVRGCGALALGSVVLLVAACGSGNSTSNVAVIGGGGSGGGGSGGGSGGGGSGASTYTLGGTVSGLAASGLVLANGSSTLSVASGATTFRFPTALATGTAYSVTVQSAPAGYSCSITNASGSIATANISSVAVQCTAPAGSTYTLGGTVSGLTASGLVLANGSTTLPVGSGATSFQFPASLPSGTTYAVTVQSAPAGYSCVVTRGSGTISGANVGNIAVSCSNLSFLLGGSVSGLVANGLVLANGGATVSVNAGSSTFAFAAPLPSFSAYAVTVQAAPAGLTCSVANGSGTITTANVGNVVVTCSDLSYTLGGTVSGLSASGLVLANGSDTVSVSALATGFTLPTAVAYTSSYQVTVSTQPTGLACTVGNGSGTMPAQNVTNVAVTCAPQTFTLGGSISGLNGVGLSITDGIDTLPVSSGASSFTLPTGLSFGASYTVSIASQPTGLNCTLSGGVGTVPANNVTTIAVTCSDLTYSLGGTISGLTTSGLHLTDGTDTIALNAASTSFGMPTPVAFGSPYAVTVASQPTGLTCSVSNGSGTMPAGNVGNVAVVCADNTYTLGGTITGLSQGGLVLTDGTDNVAVAANASIFTMPTGLAYGSSYAVTIFTQPSSESCSVTNGSGTIPAGNVSTVVVACNGAWTWMSGPDTSSAASVAGAKGVYGTQGTAASTNLPGAREGAAAWTDSSGTLWMFGGSGYGTAALGSLNDLWKFIPGTGAGTGWVWVGGSNGLNANGNYGTLGNPFSANMPGARVNAASWADASGNLWLFGGLGYDSLVADGQGSLNDLWKYNVSSKLWTWMHGSKTKNINGSYTTGGTPGSRYYAATWTDASGNLWLFGGTGYDSSGHFGNLSDLWKFSPSANQWSWVKGPSSYDNKGTYGTLGLAASTNVPGARSSAASWIDAGGNLWLFGGTGYDSTTSVGMLNDLWKFNPTTSQWTWVAGPSTRTALNEVGTYGTQGVAAGGNNPGGRYAAVAWTDKGGNFWLAGGNGYATTTTAGNLNDLWKYTAASGWAWMAGANTTGASGTYGTQGVSAGSNIPGSRQFACAWIDSTGNPWIFGGNGADATGSVGYLNDLWTY